jgi:hypothetical protein
VSVCTYYIGDTRDVAATLPDGSVDLARERIGMFLDVRHHQGGAA